MVTFKPGFYPITLKIFSGGTLQKTTVFVFQLEDPCKTVAVEIVKPNTFQSPLNYFLRDESIGFEWQIDGFAKIDTFVDCGAYVIAFSNADGSAYD